MRGIMELNFQTRTRDAFTGGGVLWQPNMAAAPTEACQMTRKNGVATLGDLSARISVRHTCLDNIK